MPSITNRVKLRLYLLQDSPTAWLFSTTGFREPPAKLVWIAKSKPVTLKSYRQKLKTLTMPRVLAAELGLSEHARPRQKYYRPIRLRVPTNHDQLDHDQQPATKQECRASDP